MPRDDRPAAKGAKPSRPTLSPYDVHDAKFVAEVRDPDADAITGLPEVAFAGRSNVGKSTLLNALCQRHGLARTSRTPGCTRGIVLFDITFRNGAAVRFVDLPGYGFADRSKGERRAWGPLIERYLANSEALKLVLILVDARRGPESEETQLAEYLTMLGRPYVVVATKTDKFSRAERGTVLVQMAKDHGVKVYGVSGETGDGREALVQSIAWHAGADRRDDSRDGNAADPLTRAGA